MTLSALSEIKGIGKKTKEKLNRNGIYDCFDLINRYPSRYEVYELSNLKDAEDDEKVTLLAQVSRKPKVAYIRKKLTKLSCEIIIEDIPYTLVIFNREYLSNILEVKAMIVITGKLERAKKRFTATTLRLKKNFENTIEPIYNVEKIGDKQMQKYCLKAVELYGYLMKDYIPKTYQTTYQLYSKQELLKRVHQPKHKGDLIQIKRRLKYEELLFFALQIAYIKELQPVSDAYKKHYDLAKVKDFIASLPFELTNDQKQATNELFKDIKSSKMMNRLLQGDTGSGKTIVAFILTMGVISSGHQVALMAPTALLAKQHYKKAKAYFEPFDVKVHLLTGHTSKAEREQIKQELIKDEALFVIGTHALFSDDISYKKLGLIITDEQHRFGVRQRQALRNKGQYPDVLYMSATPIPRTLAISVFGDMDLTTIKHKPAARKKVHTKLFNKEDLRLVYNLMEQELANNHQIYVVTPLILESVVNQEKANAQDVYQQLKKVFKDYKVGLVHGKIETEEKERMMDMFYHHEIDILVSTTVIEVGVDHANATMMVVFDSDQFGLSQLHQLRGRVGRGDSESYALLLVQNHESFDRLRVLEESDDGFYLSEKDLEMRGPGQFFGAKQSGVLSFNNASIIEDFHIFLKAKEDAQNIIKNAEDHRDLIDKIKQEIEQQKYDELWYNE